MDIKRLPKVHQHNLELTSDGTGSKNSKEYCKCENCKTLRKRRDSIYKSLKYKINRWFNTNF